MWWPLLERETGRSLELTGQPTLLGKREDGAWRVTAEAVLWRTCSHTCVSLYIQNHSVLYFLFLSRYDAGKGMESLEDTFVSQANALQRKGRAGRVASGVCFHLFTSHHYSHQLLKQQLPEIQRVPLEQLCLRWHLDVCALLPASPMVLVLFKLHVLLFLVEDILLRIEWMSSFNCKESMSRVALSFPFTFLHSLAFAECGPTIKLKNTFVN